MAKRGTSGLPKNTPESSPQAKPGSTARQQPRLIREYRTKAEREARIQRMLILSMIIVGVVVAVLVFGAILVDLIITPNQTAATVNGQSITVGQFERDVRIERAIRIFQINQAVASYRSFGAPEDQITQLLQSQPPFSTWINELQVPDQLGNTVLSQMIDDVLVRQEAERRGITVSDEQVNHQIETFFGYDPQAIINTPTPTLTPTTSPTPVVSPTASPTPTATLTPEFTPTITVTPVASNTPSPTLNPTEIFDRYSTVRDNAFTSFRNDTGLGDADIRGYFEITALREALADAVSADLGRTAPFIDARIIVVASETQASDIVAALQAGEPFADIARASSSDGSASSGGELGWVPQEQLVSDYSQAVAYAAAGAEIGQIIGPVATDDGTFVVMQVRGREERDLTDAELERRKGARLDQFLTTLRESSQIERTNAWVDNVPTDPPLAIAAQQ